MKLTTTLLGLALLAFASACKSPHERHDDIELPCICGTPEAALDGCANADCRAGVGNPDNPDCVCGPLGFEREDD